MPKRKEMNILYAGHLGSDREKDFVAFLKKHFTKVETSDFSKFNGSQAEGYDVTILDYDGDGFKAPRPTSIPQSFRKPLVTVGVVGAFVCGDLRLKMDYL